ncbi:double zinc ribbon and ankyrin repeat-containing protein 1 isoform X1 [Anguilla anguilla]|uniref:double zinc ribbon and ankyrin repeat-containing protein 1 isoform X1 n=1 Tax=Anguilla anguilla TaxID=7936 RepID=UPI0015B33C32|nr:double zinc ribbon and ankyrin repeat-containing protein 1 isoform X1 [Anguilla anguilla]
MTAGSIFVPQIIPIRVPPPGKAKHHIDTTTPVEIKSDSKDVTVYYTVDGSKPEPVKRPGFGENTTLKYKGPIRLPEGKVSVKALAVASDGRESGIVTKLFLVDYVPTETIVSTEDNEDNFLKQYARDMDNQESLDGSSALLNLSGSLRGAWEDTTKSFQGLKIQGSDSHRPPKGSRFPNSRLGTPSPKTKRVSTPTSHHSQEQNEAQGDGLRKSLTRTDISRILRETDFLRCPQCLSPRPSDPFARFCPQCGAPVPPIPEQRLPPTEGGQMRLCVHCKMVVPLNAPICIVCEAPMAPHLQPQASLRLKDKAICPSCGAGNPVNLTYCVVCETRLPDPPTARGERAPPLPISDGRMISCSNCCRVNNSDARFCDWCGAKPGHPALYLTCSCCGVNNHPYANFCGSCGVFLEGPARLGPSVLQTTGGAAQLERSTFRSDGIIWQPVPQAPPLAPAPATPRSDQQTQTVGLFYPSGAELHKKGQQVALELSQKEQMRDRRPLLTPISPGRGYWRKQLDHICAHLRSYTQNNTEFRTLIGEPRMGKMISAVVQEDNDKVSLRINFVSAGSERSKGGERTMSTGSSEHLPLSDVAEGLSSLSVSENSAPPGESRKDRKQRRANRAQEEEVTLLQSKDAQLLAAVGPGGLGQISTVQQLLDEGADASCRGSDGRPVLTVAVMNLHHEVIPLLVQKGADIDQQSGPVNNSALHEAASLGNQGLQCAEALLGCNASIRKRNDRGQTAYDLAVRSGCDPLVSLIAARMGQGLLDKLTKPRSTVNLDTF